MEINALINSIYESTGETQIELIDFMKDYIEKTKHVVIGDLNRLFIMIRSLLDNQIKSKVILSTHNLIKSVKEESYIFLYQLFKHLLPSECENNYKLISQVLLLNLADSDAAIRKSGKSVFLTFIQRTRNLEAVITQLISLGFENKNFYVRERSINLVPDIIGAERAIFFSRNGINDARKLIENVVVHLKDKNQSVREQAQKVLKKIKKENFENFDKAFTRLSQEHQLQFNNAVAEFELKEHEQKFIKLNLDALQDDQEFVLTDAQKISQFFNTNKEVDDDLKDWTSVRNIYKQFLTMDLQPNMPVEKILSLFPQDLRTKLYFGFLRGDILQDTFNDRDIKVREYGIKQLHLQFFEENEEDNQDEQYIPETAYEEEHSMIETNMFIAYRQSAIEKIMKSGFVPQFFKYVTFLLSSEQNFKIINILLNIVNRVISVPGIHVNTYLPLCLPGLVNCLDDQRVIVRRRALYLLRKLIKYLKKKQYLINILFFLDDISTSKSRGWHCKEELLNLISILILETNPREEWFHGVKKQKVDVASKIKQESKLKQSIDSLNLNDLELSESHMTDQERQLESNELQPVIEQSKNIHQEQIEEKQMNFQRILVRIAFFLDDSVAKVKQAALECLAVLCNNDSNQQNFLSLLHEILDKKVYDLIIDKLQQGRVYFLNASGNLELPLINVRKLEEQRTAFQKQLDEYNKKFDEIRKLKAEEEERRRKLGEIIVDDKTEELNEDEEEEESFYKITYYEKDGIAKKKFPMSLKDRIQKSNMSIDSLFVPDYNQIDASKYDIIVPIDSFKQTDVKIDQLQSNLVAYNEEKEKVNNDSFDYDQFEIKEEEDDDIQKQDNYLEYQKRTMKHRGHSPKEIIDNARVKVNEDIKGRVQKTMQQLNEDTNANMQIPKSIKANVKAYEGYEYKGEQQLKESEEIFIDTKKIKQEAKKNKEDDEIIRQLSQVNAQKKIQKKENKFEIADQLKQVQQVIANQDQLFTNEQKYDKRLQEFLMTFEDPEADRKRGRNARKIKRKLKEQGQQEGLPRIQGLEELSEYDLSQPLQNPIAEVSALIINFTALDIEVIINSLNIFRRLLRTQLDVVYSSQVPLVQMVNDIIKLLSTQRDNPIYRTRLEVYGDPQIVIRKVIINVMKTLSDCVLYLKRTTDPNIKYMFQSVAIWQTDQNQLVVSTADQTLLDILKYGDDRKISEILPKLYDRQKFQSKIYVGVLLEELIVKWSHGIFKSPHFSQMIHIISWMVSDQSFDVRRQGKKVYFKILSLGGDLDRLEKIIDDLHYYEAQQMRELIAKHNELEKDNQVGVKYKPFNRVLMKEPPKQEDRLLKDLSLVESKYDELQPEINDLKGQRFFDVSEVLE